jgi:Ca2+-binding EF-hand superfamily protein
MVAEAPGPINFTMFLTMFGEKLNGTDPEEVIRNAFACFDENNSGKKDFEVTVLSLFFQGS